MEKSQILTLDKTLSYSRLQYGRSPTQPNKAHLLKRMALFATCACLVIYTFTKHTQCFRWHAPITYRQGDINWTPCGDNIECGRLEVPLDYFNASLGKASLALARYPATNKTARIGTLLSNPGGPGGSGVNYIYRAGKRISELVEGKYDIVSWDPRGINGTTPRVECFPSQTAQDIFFANTHQEVLPDAGNLTDPSDLVAFKAGVKLADTLNEVYVRLCHERSGETLRHVGTATVVRDLEKIYSELEGEDEPINFYGFSYGTVVGSYLVNMFPDRVGKVIIDGVVNPDLWANTHAHTWPKDDFADTERGLQNFYEACAAAGPSRCDLATNESTAASISGEIDALLERLHQRPLAVWDTPRPGPLTASMIQTMIFGYLYRPREWSTLASHLAAAHKGDGAPIVKDTLDPVELNNTVPAGTAAAIYAVTCVDTPDFDGVDKAEALDDLVNEMVIAQQKTSRHFGVLDIDVCHHWTARETERFTGPFNNTLKNKILVIGNTADPITPVQNARAVNRMMPQSTRLVVQNGSGHCSSAMGSLCTAKTIRQYFLDGKLPENGLVCETDEELFPSKSGNVTDSLPWLKNSVQIYSKEDLALLEVMRGLGKEMESFVGTFKKPRSLRLY